MPARSQEGPRTVGWTPGTTVNQSCTFSGGSPGGGGAGGASGGGGNDGQAGAAGTVDSVRGCPSATSC